MALGILSHKISNSFGLQSKFTKIRVSMNYKQKP